jgi:rRNA processing protein Krr1/Pno1
MPTYLQEFNTLQTKILDKSYAILGEYKKLEEKKKSLTSGDSSADRSKAYEELESQTNEKVKELKKELKELVEQKQEFTSGNRNIEYIKKAAFEMNEDVSKTFIAANFINYAEAREHTTIDKIAPERLAVLRNDWAKEKETITRQDLELAYELFEKVNFSASNLLKNHLAKYFENKNVFTII